jgi:hypothetical protein
VFTVKTVALSRARSVYGTHTPCLATGSFFVVTTARVIKSVVVQEVGGRDLMPTTHPATHQSNKNPIFAVSDAVQGFYASSVGAHVMATR